MKNLLLRILLLLLLLAACSKGPQLPPLTQDGVILAFGDSLTFGTGAAPQESYPAILEQLAGRKVLNAGVPGEVSAAGAARLPELLDRERPALLILCHGGNDLLHKQSHEQLSANLKGMIRQARERGISVMLLAVPTPGLSLKPPQLYADVAREFDIPVDLTTLPKILGKGKLKSDHIHPNAAGYRLLAEETAKTLKRSGALPQ